MNTFKPFAFNEMFSAGWMAFKRHWQFIFLSGLTTIFVYLIMQSLQIIAVRSGILNIIVNIFSLLISIIVTLAWAQVFLGIIHERQVSWITLKSKPEVWLRYIKTYLWFIGYVALFSILTILPGAIIGIIGFFTDIYWILVVGTVLGSAAFVFNFIYFSLKYQFLTFAVIEYPELSSRNIFRKAGSITKGNLVRLFLFGVVIGLINLLGFILFFIGLCITIPVTKIAQAKVYNYLKEYKN